MADDELAAPTGSTSHSSHTRRATTEERLVEAARSLLAASTLDDLTSFVTVKRLTDDSGLSSGAVYSAFTPDAGVGARSRSAPQVAARRSFWNFGSEAIELVVIDCSFISLTKVLPALPSFLAPAADVVALIKPQFAVGREAVGKGGIVRVPAARRRAQEIVEAAARELGFVVRGVCDSPIRGQKGNLELLIWLTAQPR